MSRLKGKGVLQAYAIAHEGDSEPRVIGQGKQRLTWPRSVIRQLTDKIKAGTAFFLGHAETNSSDNREQVGEIITSYLKDIGGKLSSIVIGHFPNKEKIDSMDICSVEADVYTDSKNIVGDIEDVTGIALGNSSQNHPAFPGAVRLGMIQCFIGGEPIMDDNKITFATVAQAVKDMNIRPRQLYSIDDIKDDREFASVFTDNAALQAENERLVKDAKDSADAVTEAKKQADTITAASRLDSKMGDGFTDKQKAFIKSKFDPSTNSDITDSGLDTFIETAKKDFAATAKLFGVTEKELDETPGETKKSATGADMSDVEKQALKEMGVIDG